MPFEAVREVSYTTSATAKGGRGGHVASADGVVDLPLGPPGSKAHPRANPETLFAAGYAACFSGALAAVARRPRVDVSQSLVTATVTFGKTDVGYGLAVELVAELPGVEPDLAATLVEKAHALCPYTRATLGNIEATARLA